MMRFEAVIALFTDLEAGELSGWIAQSWVRPERDGDDDWVFHEVDLARVRLIYDLRRDLDTPEETMPLVLSLLDQVYELRAALKAATRALEGQPEAVREAVLAAMRGDDDPR